MDPPISHTIFLSRVTNIILIGIIQDLTNGTPGYDEITASAFKRVSCHVVDQRVYLCNLSIDQSIFPKVLKPANILPLYKTGDPFLFYHYRPVSALSILAKVFEKIMYSEMLEYLDTNKILNNYQFGFQEYHSSYIWTDYVLWDARVFRHSQNSMLVTLLERCRVVIEWW